MLRSRGESSADEQIFAGQPGSKRATWSWRSLPISCQDKARQNGSPSASASASPSRAPEIIFANWREMLNQLKLARDVRHTYAQAIEGYLSCGVGNGLSVGVESARAGVGHG